MTGCQIEKHSTVILDSNQNKIIIISTLIRIAVDFEILSKRFHFRGFVTILFKIVPLWFHDEIKNFSVLK